MENNFLLESLGRGLKMRTITDKVGEGVKQMLTTAGKEGVRWSGELTRAPRGRIKHVP